MEFEISVKLQDDTRVRKHTQGLGWGHGFAGFGIHIFQIGDGLLAYRPTNGVANAPDGIGGLNYEYIQIKSRGVIATLPRKGQTVSGGTLILGAPGEKHYFPPRASLTRRMLITRLVRGDWRKCYTFREVPNNALILPRSRKSWTDAANSRANQVVHALASGAQIPYIWNEDMLSSAMGPFQPLGVNIAYGYGGSGIEPMPGWERSSLMRILFADLAQERQPTDCLDYRTGEPINVMATDKDGYQLSRGYFKITQLPAFCEGVGPSDPDKRVPREYNLGSCSYREALLAYMPYDGQHLIRATRHPTAAWHQYGDPVSGFNLKMIEQDAWYCWDRLSQILLNQEIPQSQGSPSLGREFGWVLNATTTANRIIILLDLVQKFQMANGLIQRASYPWPFDPPAWPPIDIKYDVAQSIEAGVQGNALCDSGSFHTAARLADGLYVKARAQFGYIPKFIVVAEKGGAVIDPVMIGEGAADTFNVWWVLGRLLYQTQDSKWLDAMYTIPVPGTSTTYNNIPALYNALINNPNPADCAMAIAALESFL